MKLSFLFVLLLSITSSTPFFQIEKKYQDIFVDHHQNYYLLKPDGTFQKYNKEHQLINQQNIKLDRSISELITTNPMNLLAFFKEQQKIRIYDNFLNIIGNIDINALGLPEIACIGLSYDNQIWAIDTFNKHLYKLDWTGKTLSIIENLSNFGIHYDQIYAIKNNQQSIILHTDSGLYFLDQFGQFSHRLDFNQNLLDIDGNHLIYQTEKGIYLHNLFNFKTKQIDLNTEDILKIEIKQNLLYILRKNGVDLYNIDKLIFKEKEEGKRHE